MSDSQSPDSPPPPKQWDAGDKWKLSEDIRNFIEQLVADKLEELREAKAELEAKSKSKAKGKVKSEANTDVEVKKVKTDVRRNFIEQIGISPYLINTILKLSSPPGSSRLETHGMSLPTDKLLDFIEKEFVRIKREYKDDNPEKPPIAEASKDNMPPPPAKKTWTDDQKKALAKQVCDYIFGSDGARNPTAVSSSRRQQLGSSFGNRILLTEVMALEKPEVKKVPGYISLGGLNWDSLQEALNKQLDKTGHKGRA